MKEEIMRVTIDLINESQGNVSKVSVRKIAKELNIAVGLINYYFGTKENLIKICVDEIIKRQVTTFKPIFISGDPKEKVYQTVIQVADYLWLNQSVSTISILSDLENPKINDNTMKTVKGITFTLTEEGHEQDVLILVSTIQSYFLRRKVLSNFGINLDEKGCRDKLIRYLINTIIYKDGGKYE